MEKETKLKISENLKEKPSFFKPAGNIDNNYSYKEKKEESDEEFLRRITSGVSYRHSDDYQILSGGQIITTMEKVKEMYEQGYNIIDSAIISEIDGNTLVEIEYEFLKQKEKNKTK